MRQRDPVPAWAVGMVAALALGAAQAQQQQLQTQDAPQGAASTPVAEAQSMRAVRDKATGKLRAPTAGEVEAMEAQERADRKARGLPEAADPKSLTITRHANGMRSARLGPEYMMTLRGERSADGSVRRFHPEGIEHHRPADSGARPTE